ncbi:MULTISPECIES: hypothetical protein [unclassified Sporosarcina]|nr:MULTISPECIES: hypothetical protein [unclassified Sporosarcina]
MWNGNGNETIATALLKPSIAPKGQHTAQMPAYTALLIPKTAP